MAHTCSAQYLCSLFSLAGKTAIVTGGSRGIGKGLAVAIASAGANIIIPVRTPKAADDTKSTIEALGRTCTTYPCDLSSQSETSTLISRIFESPSAPASIDILINCAGHHNRLPAEEYTDAQIAAIWQVNLGGAFTLSRDLAKYWLTHELSSGCPADGHRKKIINTASVLSFSGGTHLAAYTATKGGIAQFTKTMSNEWSARGINVNAIAPGYVKTDLTQDLIKDPEKNKYALMRTPIGRWGDPNDLAGAVVWLASAAGDWVTGGVFPVDGGYTAW